MSNNINNLATTISANNSSNNRTGSWFEKMAEAWGAALDKQADNIVTQSEQLVDGAETPQQITRLSAESMRMGFLSNSAHTSINSVGTSLETLARKQ